MQTAKTTANYNPNSKISLQSNKKDSNNSSLNTGYEYVPTLRPAGYVVGQPISVPTKQVRPTTPIIVDNDINRTSRITTSKNTSRVVYGPDTIVHEHPSRPARSPSPIGNPNANIIPQTNFIYNSAGTVTMASPPPMRVVSYSPLKSTTTVVEQTTVPIPVHMPVSPKQNTANMVPRAQYQRCVTQCRTWQQRYNELYEMYVKINNQKINKSISDNASKLLLQNNQNLNALNQQQYEFTIRQNKKLKDRVRQLERNQQRLFGNMEDIITKLCNKYRDSTLKECLLLADRYRLEKKMNDR